MRRPSLPAFAALLALAPVPAAAADGPAEVAAGPAIPGPHSHIRTPGEIDDDHGPLMIDLTYTGEVMSNRGGLRNGSRYLDNLDIVAEADLDRLIGWRGAEAHIYGLYNNGRSISALTGDAQGVSNIETGIRALRLYEAWIEQKFGDSASLLVGLYDLNSEFDSLDSAGLFVGSAHGIGSDIGLSGVNGPSIFPVTSLAARVEVKAGGWTLRAAALDGVPGDPDHPRRTAIHLRGRDGALLIAEAEAPVGSGDHAGKLLFGHWRYTARADTHDGGRRRGNAGYYLRGEKPLFVDPDGGRLDAFFRLGIAAARFNMVDRFASAGLKWTTAKDHEIGLAVASAFTSDAWRRANGGPRAETAIEGSYRLPIAGWITVQPNLQWVISPASAPGIDDALVAGVRFVLGWRAAG